jgi:hypothetical protein
MVLAPHVQRGSFTVGRRAGGLARMPNTFVLRLGGMLESTGWADKAGWANEAGWTDAICWPAVYRLMQTARRADTRVIAACIGIRALTTFIGEPKLMRMRILMVTTIMGLVQPV